MFALAARQTRQLSTKRHRDAWQRAFRLAHQLIPIVVHGKSEAQRPPTSPGMFRVWYPALNSRKRVWPLLESKLMLDTLVEASSRTVSLGKIFIGGRSTG